MLLWVLAFAQGLLADSAWTYNAFGVPVLLVSLLLVRFDQHDVETAATVLALSVLSLAIAGVAFAPDSSSWTEPFTHENYAGTALSFGAVYLLLRRRPVLFLLGCLSAGLVLASGSRTGVVAIALGLWIPLVHALASKPGSGAKRAFLTAGCLLPAALLVVWWMWGDRSFNGRLDVWRDFLHAWREAGASPTGLGSATLQTLMDQGLLGYWSHGHNQFVDTTVRYGSVGLILSLLALGSMSMLLLRARRSIPAWAMAIPPVFVVVAALETPTDWLYLTIPYAWLLLVVALAMTVGRVVLPAKPDP